jgi:glycerol-3-phosphate dehydrogenase (NAD(P)+)
VNCEGSERQAAKNVAVVPAGIWGTALALVLADNGHSVRLWHRDEEVVEAINRDRVNPRHLADTPLPRGITGINSLERAMEGAAAVVVVPASHAFREVMERVAAAAEPEQVFLSATKGLEPGSHNRMSEVMADYLAGAEERTAVLSGPNFAVEVAQRLPTSTVVASKSRATAELFQSLFFNTNFRVYVNPDITGVELAGSLKNVLAIGVGIASGMGLGYNATAALITRGITELTRLGLELGAHPLTFAGLAGLGDIVLTCTSDLSRNRRTGVLLGEGKSLETILEETGMTVEGLRTTRAAHELGEKLDIELPIVEQIHAILYEEKPLHKAVHSLMQRGQKPEIERAFLEEFTEEHRPPW